MVKIYRCKSLQNSQGALTVGGRARSGREIFLRQWAVAWWWQITFPFSLPTQGERATGYGVALLNTLFGAYTNSAMLKENSPVTVTNGGGDNLDGSRSKKARKKWTMNITIVIGKTLLIVENSVCYDWIPHVARYNEYNDFTKRNMRSQHIT